MSARRDIVHLDLSRGLTSLDGPAGGVLVVLWWRDVPLGQLVLEAPELPVSAAVLAGLALQAIAPALDAYLAGDQLRSPRRRLNGLDEEAEAPRLLRAALSLLDSLSLVPLRGNLPGSRAPGASAARVPEAFTLDTVGASKSAIRPSISTATPPISVVVPTRDRPNRLAACLRSLSNLREKPLEVIVVDNAPAAGDSPLALRGDEPSAATRRVVEGFAGVRCIAEPRRGSSAARNAGVAACRGELVAFVDDDETVHPDWLSRLGPCFRDPAIGLVTGLVLPAELETEAQLIFEQRYSFSRGYVARTFDADLHRARRHRGMPAWDVGGSGNMAIRRDVFERLGGFDERLGAGRAGGCEELELFYRALAAGWSCRYEPRAVTHHRHRRDMASLTRQLHAYMRGHVAAVLTQWAGRRDAGSWDFGNLHHLFWTLPKVYFGYSLRCLLGDRAYRASHLAAEIAGCLSGVRYYRRHRSQDPRPAPQARLDCPQASAMAGG